MKIVLEPGPATIETFGGAFRHLFGYVEPVDQCQSPPGTSSWLDATIEEASFSGVNTAQSCANRFIAPHG